MTQMVAEMVAEMVWKKVPSTATQRGLVMVEEKALPSVLEFHRPLVQQKDVSTDRKKEAR